MGVLNVFRNGLRQIGAYVDVAWGGEQDGDIPVWNATKGAYAPGAPNGLTTNAFSDLAAKTGSANSTAFIYGHTSPDDGGGGWFTWGESPGDDDGGIIVNILATPGAAWVRVFTGPIDVRWFGASTAFSDTVNATAIQAAIAAAVGPLGSGIVFIPPGVWNCGALTIPNGTNSLTIRGGGCSTPGTRLNFTSTIAPGILASGTVGHVTIEDIYFTQSSSSASHVISCTSVVRFLTLQRINFALSNPASSFLRMNNANPALVTMREFDGQMASAASLPAVSFVTTSNIFTLTIEHGTITARNNNTAPIFLVDGGTANSASIGVIFKNVILEQITGGGIVLASVAQATLQSVCSADCSTPTAPAILIKQNGGGLVPPYDTVLINCWLQSGSPTYPDVEADTGAYGPVIIGSRLGYLKSVNPPIISAAALISSLVSPTVAYWVQANGAVTGCQGLSSTNVIPRHLCGTATFATSGSKIVDLSANPEADGNYHITVTGNASETFYVDIAGQTGSAFTVHSSNASSTATFVWQMMR